MIAAEETASGVLARTLAQGEGMSRRAWLDLLGARGSGAALAVLGVLALIPLRVVWPQILGAAVLVIGARLLAGRLALPAPRAWAEKPAAASVPTSVSGGALVALGWIERVFKPRYGALAAAARWSAGLVGVLCAGGLLASLPALLPALTLVLLGLGLLERDGLALVIGVALGAAWAAFIGTILAGLALGAPFAEAWLAEAAPWFAR